MTQFRSDDEQEHSPGEAIPEPPSPQEDSATDSPTERAGSAAVEPARPAGSTAGAEPGKTVEPAGHFGPVASSGHDCACPNCPPRDVLHLIQRLVDLAVGELTAGKRALAILALVVVILSAPVLGIWAMAANSGFWWGLVSFAVIGAVAVTSWLRAWVKSSRDKAAPASDTDGSGTRKDSHKRKGTKRRRDERGKKPEKD